MLEAFIIDKINRENNQRDSQDQPVLQLPLHIETEESRKQPKPPEKAESRTFIEIDI